MFSTLIILILSIIIFNQHLQLVNGDNNITMNNVLQNNNHYNNNNQDQDHHRTDANSVNQ
ncbi:hypothetical protein DERP_011592 [Dermatophagoides pteronyssinus]|uniref:Uncharacterized protein n=1 Tax=Dermatophagoides pteronyssinus TaxID=6956 RepID=A0ABQ8JWC5_DERPT|nr:hypothetical protein DERP_011592 [Dermatophagoides pteronyssinus]